MENTKNDTACSETVTIESEAKLKRTLGFWGLVFFGIVFMSPTAVMTFFGYTQVTTQGHTVITFVFATAVVLLSALSYAKMVQVYPNAGSAYTYTTKTIGPKFGFVVGWAMMLDYMLTPMFMFTLTSLYLNRLYPFLPGPAWLVIVAILVFLINLVGFKLSKIFNTGAALFQFGLALIIATMGTIYTVKHGTALGYTGVIYNPDTFTMSGLLVASTVGILAFMGFDGISTVAEETTVKPKSVGRAIIVAVALQGACLIGLGYVCSILMPIYTEIANPDTVAYDIYNIVGGQTFTQIFLTIKCFLLLMGSATITTAASRLLFSMGRDGVLPKPLAYISPKFNTPIKAVAFVVVICLIGGLTLNWETIAEIVSFGGMIGFAFVNISVIKHFWIKMKDRSHVISNLILPLVGALSVVFVIYNSSVQCRTLGSIWMICGIAYLFIAYATSNKFKEAIHKGNIMG